MSLSIVDLRLSRRRSFTMMEMMISVTIVLFIIVGSLGIFRMGWIWWNETAPVIEAQRIARVALSITLEGMVDATAGTVSGNARRSGVAWAVYDPAISDNIETGDKISFGLEKEKEDFGDYPVAHNIRSFYLGQDASGVRAVYYRNNASQVTEIEATRGITKLLFSKATDSDGKVYLSVTATVEKDIKGTRNLPRHIKVEYTDGAYLRNFR